MKIAFYIPGFAVEKGGAQRVGANLANWLASRGHEPIIFFNRFGSNLPAYKLDEKVATVPLSVSATSIKELPYLDKVSCICSFFYSDEISWPILMAKYYKVPLIVAERVIGWRIGSRFPNPTCRDDIHCAADGIVLLCNQFKSSVLPQNLAKTIIIPNAISKNYGLKDEPKERKKILFAGRLLEDQKRLSLLLEAFAILKDRFENWDLDIVGDGADRRFYENLADKLALKGRVKFAGIMENMDPWYETSDIFCLPSPAEGMSMAMLEAQAHNLPYVGFACCQGVEDVITDGFNGLLCGEFSSSALAATLAKLMEDDSLRKRLALGAHQRSEEFASEKIFGRWENLFMEMANRREKPNLDTIFKDENNPLKDRLSSLMNDYPKMKYAKFMAQIINNCRKTVRKNSL